MKNRTDQFFTFKLLKDFLFGNNNFLMNILFQMDEQSNLIIRSKQKPLKIISQITLNCEYAVLENFANIVLLL